MKEQVSKSAFSHDTSMHKKQKINGFGTAHLTPLKIRDYGITSCHIYLAFLKTKLAVHILDYRVLLSFFSMGRYEKQKFINCYVRCWRSTNQDSELRATIIFSETAMHICIKSTDIPYNGKTVPPNSWSEKREGKGV